MIPDFYVLFFLFNLVHNSIPWTMQVIFTFAMMRFLCTIINSVDFFKGSMILTYLFFNIARNNIPWTMQAVFFTLAMVILLRHP